MCNVCGCGQGETRIAGEPASKDHAHDHDHHHHGHGHDGHGHHHHHHGPDGALHFGMGAAGASAPAQSQTRLVEIEEDVLSRNNAVAAQNRARFAEAVVVALNLVSSPGAGKTSLLIETLRKMGETPAAVIEGDQESSTDAQRIRETGAPAIQINTGKGCHLDAAMVSQAVDHLPEIPRGVLFIENVGNLVCPAGFDLGEAHRVVIVSVTEGEDKPLKYPGMFATSDLMIVSKTDLAPHVDVDINRLIANARKVKPGLMAIALSTKTGEGMSAWLEWLSAARAMQRAAG